MRAALLAALRGHATVAVLLSIAAAAPVLASCGSTSSLTGERAGAPASCEGQASLCDRRLDEVVFPATHNSFAASDQPGWYFASQRHAISRQLDDGIRGLLIDVHYGVRDQATGSVRTDLSAEGSDRNKVVAQLSPAAVSVADRVAGGVGLGTLHGAPEPFLCHTLCELGAEPLDRELEVIRSFLRGHPDQVLLVIVEDYVSPATIAEAFARTGLDRDVATLDLHAPMPTLGALIEKGRRLLVFAEKQGGTPTWYMPAFSFIEDTPLGAVRPDQLSCRRYRGEETSPLLLINHWIPPFPPSPALNAAIGRSQFLRARIARCMRQRGRQGAIVAVDFYERTSVVAAARELNARR